MKLKLEIKRERKRFLLLTIVLNITISKRWQHTFFICRQNYYLKYFSIENFTARHFQWEIWTESWTFWSKVSRWNSKIGRKLIFSEIKQLYLLRFILKTFFFCWFFYLIKYFEFFSSFICFFFLLLLFCLVFFKFNFFFFILSYYIHNFTLKSLSTINLFYIQSESIVFFCCFFLYLFSISA